MTFCRRFSTLVVVDPTVADYQALLKHIPAAHVLVLNREADGIEQITQALAAESVASVQHLHILSHGCVGELQLGNTRLNSTTLTNYISQLQTWATLLSQQAEILLYGCEVAAGALGKQFVRQLKRLTGAEIAASSTLTGNRGLGGNWNLEFTTGQISAPPVFTAKAMSAYAHVLAVLLNETFTGSDVVDNTAWLFGTGPGTTSVPPFLTARSTSAPSTPSGLPGSPTGTALDAPGQGVLRLTNNSNNQASFVLYNKPIDETAGLKVTFDLFSYGGTSGRPDVPIGADGLSFFLVNGTSSPTSSGAFGGSLGYAQKIADGIPGITGGYLGLGFDEFGNFSSATDYTGGPTTRIGGPGFTPDSVGIRGSQATNYAYLTGSSTLPFSIDNVAAGANRANSKRQVEVDLSPQGLLTVMIDSTPIINQLNISTNNGTPPATFKFGFAAGTGVSTNFHEVRNLVIQSLPLPTTVNVFQEVTRGSNSNVVGLSGTATDPNATIASYSIVTLPPAAQGILYLGNPSSGGTPIQLGQTLTPSQLSQLYFASTPSFNGSSFTYTATDSNGKIGATPSTVTLGVNDPPVVYNTTLSRVLSNTTVRVQAPLDDNNPPPPVSNLTGPIGTDIDRSPVASYTILSLPTARQGKLFLGNPNRGGKAVKVNQVLSPDQISTLFFRASSNFQKKATFDYSATDTLGVSAVNPATVTITGFTNIVDDTPNNQTLTGGGTDNRYIFLQCKNNPDLVTNFRPTRDLIDLKALFADCPGGINIYRDYIKVSGTGNGTLVSVGDGTGSFTPLTVLANVAPGQVNRSNFLF
jgi:hypothetical protein